MEVNQKLEKAKEAILHRDSATASEIYHAIIAVHPQHVDAWNGLGAVAFEKGELEESLRCYRKAHDFAMAEFGGKYPRQLVWIEVHKPALRALHGIGLNLYRLGRIKEAQEIFENMLQLNPVDDQGVKFLLNDIKKGSVLWKKK